MSYQFVGSASLGSSKAAATITATVVDLAGSALGSQPTRTVVNLGGGVFGVSVPDMPDAQTGWVLLKEGSTVLVALGVSPAETENADVRTSTRGTGTSTYAGGDTAGTTTLLSRVTSGRATLLDNLDAAITTRMATFTYTAPPTAAANLAAWKADADVIGLLDDAAVAGAVGAALDLMIVTDGAGAYEFTAGALANAPTGGSAPTAADIWSHATRTLTAGTNIALAKGTGLTGLNDLSAAAVNAEADAALADVGLTTTVTGRIDVASSTLAAAAALAVVDDLLDTEIAAIKADTAAILADTAELQADWHDGGRLDLLLDDAAAGGSGGTVTLDLAQTLDAPRALDSVADAAMTVNDALWAATVEMAGDMARSGVTLTKKTPATGTTVRTLTFDSASAPTSRT